MLKSTTAMADSPAMWWPAIAIVVLVVGIAATVHFARNGHAARHRDAKRASSMLEEATNCDDPVRHAQLLEQAASALLRVRSSDTTPISRLERQRDATFVLGFVRYEQERYLDAIELLQIALRQPLTKATRARGLAWIATAAALCGDEELARASFAALMKIRTTPSARREYRVAQAIHMAVLCARRGAFADADAHLHEAKPFTRFAVDPSTWRARAEVELYRENFDEANRLIAAAVREDESGGWRAATVQAQCWALRARLELARRDLAPARAALARAQTLAPATALAVRVELLTIEAALARLEGTASDAPDRATALLRQSPLPVHTARLAAEEVRHTPHSTEAAERAAKALRSVGETLAAAALELELGLNISPTASDRPG